MPKIKPLARRADIVVQELEDEILIYDLTANKVFNLNKGSMLVWQLSNGDKTISEIADDLTGKFNSPVNEEFVWLALEQLRKEKLIENEVEISSLYQEVSRREVVKKVGLATVIALPIVSSIIAPMAVQAASCVRNNDNCAGSNRPNGCQCTNGSVCASGNCVDLEPGPGLQRTCCPA